MLNELSKTGVPSRSLSTPSLLVAATVSTLLGLSSPVEADEIGIIRNGFKRRGGTPQHETTPTRSETPRTKPKAVIRATPVFAPKKVDTSIVTRGSVQLPSGAQAFARTHTTYHSLGANPWLLRLIQENWIQRGGSKTPTSRNPMRDTYTATLVDSAPTQVGELLKTHDIVLSYGSGGCIGYVSLAGKYIAFKYGAGSAGFAPPGSVGKNQSLSRGVIGSYNEKIGILTGAYYKNFYTGTPEKPKSALKGYPYGLLPADGGTPGADMLSILARTGPGDRHFHGSSAKVNGFFSNGCFRLRTADIILLYEIGKIRTGAKFTSIRL